jgi:hypothetical protein
LYSSQNIIRVVKSRRMKWARMWDTKIHNILVGKSEEMRKPERLKPKWENNIKMHLKWVVLVCNGSNWFKNTAQWWDRQHGN